MDSVVFDGVTYTKASVIAKNFRYTSDYIGQLCRGKKVDARLVGRTWFINETSLIEHRKSKYSNVTKKSDRSLPVVDKLQSGDNLERVKVYPVLNTKAVKSLNHNLSKGLNKSVRKLKIAYELDDEFLIPTLTKKHYQPPKEIRIEHAESTKINISGEKTSMSFLPTPVPEVSLSGKLKIETVVETVEKDESIDDTLLNKDITDEKPIVKTDNANRRTLKFFSKKNKFLPEKKSKIEDSKNNLKSESNKITLLLKNEELDKAEKPVPELSNLNDKVMQNGSIANVLDGENIKLNLNQVTNNLPTNVNSIQEPFFLIRIAPLLATVIAFIFVLGILSASNVVVAGRAYYDSVTTFSIKDLLNTIKY